MSGAPFLLEIGTEEIPDWMIQPALEDLKRSFTALLDEAKLGGAVSNIDATPRRLVLWADGLLDKQADTEELVMGPPAAAAFKDGQPTGAALGFAKKMNVPVEQLRREATPKGEYLAYLKAVPGRATKEVLAERLPALITNIPWPKTMYWTGKNGPRFIRPIRWIVALLGDEVVPFEIAGVPAGKVTHTHRQLGQGPVEVAVGNYEHALWQGGVFVSSTQRRDRIEKGIQEILSGLCLTAADDPKLLNTLVYLTEHPTPITGFFDQQFLRLPKEVLVTVMRHHQRYFSVLNAKGELQPQFIAVTNTNGDPQGLIRRGHERVLKARFKDATFFYDVDQQKLLHERLEDLKAVTFHAKLGSYREKTDRVVALAGTLAQELEAEVAASERAALLAKCDLTTEMVKEFTDLQGIIGSLYAKAQGEEPAVAEAIYDHYKPLSMEDAIPRSLTGRVVALADKLDTLRECFRVGIVPTGSKDPFALRRAAQGVIKILVEGEVPLRFNELAGGNEQLQEFLLDRVRYYFREIRGFRYDEVNAVLKASGTNGPGEWTLHEVLLRLQAVQAVRHTPDFEPIAASFKRIDNILRQAMFASTDPVNVDLLEEGPEKLLFQAYGRVARELEGADYETALRAIASLRPDVDLFFDKVLVNAPDARVRENRLRLLELILQESSTIADFGEIVTSQNQ